MPDPRHLRATVALATATLAAFYVVYGGAWWLTSLHEWRWRLHFAFETSVPFVPGAAAVYLSLGAMLLVAPWVLRSWRETVPLALAILAETLVAGACFLLFPIESGFAERDASGPFAAVFGLADLLNLDGNEVPSLHVAVAFTVALVLGQGRGPAVRASWLAWALMIAGSAFLMHEHHLVDIGSGIVLAVAGVQIAHRRFREPTFLDGLYVDWACLREFTCFARRHARYAVLFLVMLRASLPGWRRMRLARAAYCLAQHVDDVLDGDRAVDRPLDYVDRVVRSMSAGGSEAAGPGRIGALARFVAAELDRRATAGVDPRSELLELFEVLKRDHARLEDRRVWTAAQLAAHHRRTFHLSVDLMLIVLGSRLRADDAGPLVDALSWCSPHRDLEEDLERGLVNVPREVIDGIRSGRDRAFSEWIREELAKGAAALAASRRGLSVLRDKDAGRRALALLTSAIERYARRYERTHASLLAGSADLPEALRAITAVSPETGPRAEAT